MRTQVGPCEVADVDAVEEDRSSGEFVESHDEVDQGRLACTGGPDDGNGVARIRGERDVFDERGLLGVAEAHVGEVDAARSPRRQRRRRLVRFLFLGVEELEGPFGGGDTGLEHVRHSRHLRDRLRELPRVLDERRRITESHLPRGHTQTAGHGDEDIAEVRDELHRGMIIPDTNWAPAEALYSSSLRRSNSSSMTWSRPKARTTSRPENDSSTWPLTSPVYFHWL